MEYKMNIILFFMKSKNLISLYINMNKNCVDIQKNPNFNVNGLTRLNADKCYLDEKFKISSAPGDYNLFNYYDCTCQAPAIKEISTKNVMVTFNDGYGWSQCAIDKDSEFRTDPGKMTQVRSKKPLLTRPYLTVPYMGRGEGESDTESVLRIGEDTNEHRSGNTLSGIYIDRFDPQLDHIKENVQNPIHLIQQDNDINWIRGGQPSRQIIRNQDYLQKCGFQYNGKYWSR